MGMKSSSSGPGPLVWILAVTAMVALVFFGWRSNQTQPVAAPASAPAAAPAAAPRQTQEPAPPPVRTETNGGLPG